MTNTWLKWKSRRMWLTTVIMSLLCVLVTHRTQEQRILLGCCSDEKCCEHSNPLWPQPRHSELIILYISINGRLESLECVTMTHVKLIHFHFLHCLHQNLHWCSFKLIVKEIFSHHTIKPAVLPVDAEGQHGGNSSKQLQKTLKLSAESPTNGTVSSGSAPLSVRETHFTAAPSPYSNFLPAFEFWDSAKNDDILPHPRWREPPSWFHALIFNYMLHLSSMSVCSLALCDTTCYFVYVLLVPAWVFPPTIQTQHVL